MSIITNSLDSVCQALADAHDEASLWHLSDELAIVAPRGIQAVEAVVAEAKVRGIPTKAANTLRLYRDVAINFPPSERVKGVSFSAHREALGGYNGDTAQAKALLLDLATKHGADGVSISTVKKACAAATGKALPAASGKAGKAQSSYMDVARDLASNGAKGFISGLDTIIGQGVTLDALHSGLTKLIGEVETRRSKAARKSARQPLKAGPVKARNVATANGKPVASATKRPARAGAGDLRGL